MKLGVDYFQILMNVTSSLVVEVAPRSASMYQARSNVDVRKVTS